MQDYEKLGQFYLGREYDLTTRAAKEDLILYDSRDLVTHAVVVGMTGSGKTGLCIGLIEEAAIDNVPAIIIDPKGDLADLLLTFPQLRPDDFLPWINLDEARQKNVTPEEYAAQQARLWSDGIAKWGQSGERIQKLRDSAEFRVYTPASTAGFPVSILKSFAAPPAEVLEDAEILRERVGVTVTSLLGLVGIDADPVQSREYILLANIIETTWRSGKDLDLAALIQQVQNPAITKIGVLDLETFYPGKERFGLVMALNNLIASPGFNAWLEGEPLDIGSILYTPQGKPRIAIFSIAHLGDPERMFFLSLLFNQVVGWMRSQAGTSSLRAILYMDEIFGFMPPTSNPPTKRPMLTLLKQARAFGLGVVLATQNPVDLDYKALSNAGTWFVGRLQTERDKARVLDGLEGAATAAGAAFNRQDMDTILSGLGSRVFLMNNTHEDVPVVMTTRWTLSYLRGPLTRDNIKSLMAPLKAAAPAPAQTPAAAEPKTQPPAQSRSAAAPQPAAAAASPGYSSAPPALPPEIPVYYLPVRGYAPAGSRLAYRPGLVGAARITFSDTKSRLSEVQSKVFQTTFVPGPIPVDWQTAVELDIPASDLERQGQPNALFSDLPGGVTARAFTGWTRDLTNWIYGSQAIEVLRSPSLGEFSQPGEAERDFRVRLAQMAREKRDDAVEALRKKYAAKFNVLQDRLRRAQQNTARQKDQARTQGLGAAMSIGSTLLGAFTGRRVTSSASSAVSRVSRSLSERGDIQRAEDSEEAVRKQWQELQTQFDQEAADLAAKIDPATEQLDRIAIRPKKTDIAIQLVALAWSPFWETSDGTLKPAW